jgi:hypothetical protein
MDDRSVNLITTPREDYIGLGVICWDSSVVAIKKGESICLCLWETIPSAKTHC